VIVYSLLLDGVYLRAFESLVDWRLIVRLL